MTGVGAAAKVMDKEIRGEAQGQNKRTVSRKGAFSAATSEAPFASIRSAFGARLDDRAGGNR